MDIRIYIAMSEPGFLSEHSVYSPLHIGPSGADAMLIERADGSTLFVPADTLGKNIADKYEKYGPMTALYYNWKNNDAGIVGVLPCDRYFTTMSKEFMTRHWDEKEEYILTTEEYLEVFKKNDIVLSQHRNLYIRSLYALLNKPDMADMQFLKDIIAEIYPEYLPYVNKTYRQTRGYIDGASVMRKQLMDSACEFLFTLLDVIDKRMEQAGNKEYNITLYSLMITNIWINYAKDHGAKVKELHCMNLNSTNV